MTKRAGSLGVIVTMVFISGMMIVDVNKWLVWLVWADVSIDNVIN
jgi:hypothetical protein